MCGYNVHVECQRYASEFCLYPFKLPLVLLGPDTYPTLASSRGNTSRVVIRRGAPYKPLVPGEPNTLAPEKARLAYALRLGRADAAAASPFQLTAVRFSG